MSRDRDTWDPAASGPPISGPMGSDGPVESGAAVESGPGLTSGPDLVRPAASEVADDARYARDGTLGLHEFKRCGQLARLQAHLDGCLVRSIGLC